MSDKCSAGHTKCPGYAIWFPGGGTKHCRQHEPGPHCILNHPIDEECKEAKPCDFITPNDDRFQEIGIYKGVRGCVIHGHECKEPSPIDEDIPTTRIDSIGGEQPEKVGVLGETQLNGLYITLEHGDPVPGHYVKRLKATIHAKDEDAKRAEGHMLDWKEQAQRDYKARVAAEAQVKTLEDEVLVFSHEPNKPPSICPYCKEPGWERSKSGCGCPCHHPTTLRQVAAYEVAVRTCKAERDQLAATVGRLKENLFWATERIMWDNSGPVYHKAKNIKTALTPKLNISERRTPMEVLLTPKPEGGE